MSIKDLFGKMKTEGDAEYIAEAIKLDAKSHGYFEEGDFNTDNLYSRYWLRTVPDKAENKSLIEMSSIRRAVARFVHIATGNKKIKVLFNVGNKTMTDSECVYISADVTNKNFDSVVGLALHESSHILYSSFFKRGEIGLNQTLLDLAAKKNVKNIEKLKQLYFEYWNTVEDRRVDALMWDRVYGYRPYYDALFARFVYSKIASLGLRSSFYRDKDFKSYIFRTIGLHAKKEDIDLNALPELDKINSVFDIPNIRRLKTSADSGAVAEKIFEIVLRNIDPVADDDPLAKNNGDSDNTSEKEDKTDKKSDSSKSGGKGDGKGDKSEGKPEKGDDTSDGTETGDLVDADDAVNDPHAKDGEKKEDKPKLSPEQKKELDKAVEELRDMVKGNVKKSEISDEEANEIEAIDASGASIEVGGKGTSHGKSFEGHKVIVIRDMNDEVVKLLSNSIFYNHHRNPSEACVAKGVRLGKLLANRLQIRNETKVTKLVRKRTGHIEKRLLHGLGYGMETIFSQVSKDAFGDAILHISIDASSSMGGSKWDKTMVMAVALAYAATQVGNLKVVISFRWDSWIGTSSNYSSPAILFAYDSRKDNFGKIRKYFPMMCASGGTPEGLCFDATMKDILASTKGKVAYFVNVSDGEPNGYDGVKDIETLTRDAVDKMRANGIRVMSFFVSDYDNDGKSRSAHTFRSMYGKDSRFINVVQIVPLAKELNKLFSTIKRNN